MSSCPGYCPDCGRSWSGCSEAHCAACCTHFTSDRAFDLHLASPNDEVFDCFDPADVVNKDGRPLLEWVEERSAYRVRDPRGPFSERYRSALSSREPAPAGV